MSVSEELECALIRAEANLRGTEGATDRAVDLLVRYRNSVLEEASVKAGGLSRQEAVQRAVKDVAELSKSPMDLVLAKAKAVAVLADAYLGTTSSREDVPIPGR